MFYIVDMQAVDCYLSLIMAADDRQLVSYVCVDLWLHYMLMIMV